MLEELIKKGRRLYNRLEKEYQPGIETLAPEERVWVNELDAWYNGVTVLLEDQFGTESAEAQLWRNGLERIRKDSWDGVGRVTPRGGHWVLHLLEGSLGLLEKVRLLQFKMQGNASDTARAIAELVNECQAVALNGTYADDLLASLRELRSCFENSCHIACLALCGKLLEIALKQLLMDHQVSFGEKWMIGQLLDVVRQKEIPRYIDPCLYQVGEIINQSRIPAVHAKEKVPVPSREQAAMVINAMIDTLRRTLIAPTA